MKKYINALWQARTPQKAKIKNRSGMISQYRTRRQPYLHDGGGALNWGCSVVLQHALNWGGSLVLQHVFAAARGLAEDVLRCTDATPVHADGFYAARRGLSAGKTSRSW